MVGNFPQAFSHVALVNSASNLTPAGAGTTRHRTEAATGPTERAASGGAASGGPVRGPGSPPDP
jgi:hypothetical protein